MFINKFISYIKRNGIFYAFKSRYYQYRLEHGKGWQLCGFGIEKAKENKGTASGEIKISILVPIYNTPINYLKQMLDSVLWQTYDNWELCIADASGSGHGEVSGICRDYAETEKRILYKKIKNNGIAENTNVCISMSSGDYIAPLDHDDILHPEALESVVKEIKEKNADMVYTDEAVFEERLEKIKSLQIKPGYSPENLRGCNYICHLCVFSRELLGQVGGYRKQFDGSQDYDMVLRLTEKAQNISHISKVLYYWRMHSGSVAAGLAAKSYASEAGRMAVSEHLKRIGVSGETYTAEESEVVYRIKYKTENGQEKLSFSGINDIGGVRLAKGSRYVLLMQEGVTDLSENDIFELEAFAGRKEVGMVTGTMINSKGQILQGPNSITENGEIMNLFRKHHIQSVSLMNRMLYAQNVEIVGAGFFIMRRELYGQYEKEMQAEKYSTSVMQKVSLEISRQGSQNIFIPYIRAEYGRAKKPDLGMKRLAGEYDGFVDKYANPCYWQFRNWIKI